VIWGMTWVLLRLEENDFAVDLGVDLGVDLAVGLGVDLGVESY
jgi:hypothetical protein